MTPPRVRQAFRFLLWAGTVLVLAGNSAVAGQIWSGASSFYLGLKHLGGDWEPVENQIEYGAEVSWGKIGWPVLLATDLRRSADERKAESAGNDNGSTLELDVGARRFWSKGKRHVFLGGGLAVVSGKLDRETGSDRATGLGPWLGGGVFWTVTEGGAYLGLSFRLARAKVDLLGQSVDAGGANAGLLWGLQW